MQFTEFIPCEPALDPTATGEGYFCNPYHTRHEQYGLEFLDRNASDDDETSLVVILGYN